MTFHHWLIRRDPYNDPYIKPGRADIIPGYVSSKFHQGQPVTGRTIFLHGFSPGKSWGVFLFSVFSPFWWIFAVMEICSLILMFFFHIPTVQWLTTGGCVISLFFTWRSLWERLNNGLPSSCLSFSFSSDVLVRDLRHQYWTNTFQFQVLRFYRQLLL